MSLSFSGIAWEPEEDDQVASLLREYQVGLIDIAPGKYFHDFGAVTEREALEFKRRWADRGVAINGMQSLLYGTKGLNVFGTSSQQKLLIDHMANVTRLGGLLEANKLVFGSPKNRDRTGLTDEQVLDQASEVFWKVGEKAQSNGVIVCLEPNPERYGANFMRNSAETAQVVSNISHPAIKLQLDTGAITINAENIDQILAQYSSLIGHIHISEPDLLPIGDGGGVHSIMAASIKTFLVDPVLSIEMVATSSEDHLSSMRRALEVTVKHYSHGERGDPNGN